MTDATHSKIRTIVFVSILCLSVVAMSVAFTGSVSAQETVDSDVTNDATTENVNNLAGSGTEDDPYIITDVTELQLMEDDLFAYYELGNDIDASSVANFEPIGDTPSRNSDVLFIKFDGAGHTISGLTIDRPSTDAVGLFKYVASENDAYVKNVVLEDVDITGNRDVGGLMGQNSARVENVSVSGTVDGSFNVGMLIGSAYLSSSVAESDASGTVSGDDIIGGLIGINGGDIVKSHTTADVSGGNRAGGLTGDNDGLVSVTYATGDVGGDETVGGLVGYHSQSSVSDGSQTEGTIEESYATGEVTGTEGVGGLLGVINQGSGATVSDSYWDTDTSGQSTSAGGTGLTTSEMTGNAAASNMNGFDFETNWETTNSYPDINYDTGSDDPLSRFDQDGSGLIEFSEVLNAIAAHNSGSQIGGEPVTFPDVLAVISAHNNGTTIGS